MKIQRRSLIHLMGRDYSRTKERGVAISQIQTGTIYAGIYSQSRHRGRPDCSVYEPRRTTALNNSPAYRNGGCRKGYGFHGAARMRDEILQMEEHLQSAFLNEMLPMNFS